jgi:hypothetical protein
VDALALTPDKLASYPSAQHVIYDFLSPPLSLQSPGEAALPYWFRYGHPLSLLLRNICDEEFISKNTDTHGVSGHPSASAVASARAVTPAEASEASGESAVRFQLPGGGEAMETETETDAGMQLPEEGTQEADDVVQSIWDILSGTELEASDITGAFCSDALEDMAALGGRGEQDGYGADAGDAGAAYHAASAPGGTERHAMIFSPAAGATSLFASFSTSPGAYSSSSAAE